jgi:hypothetical protein
VVRPLRLSTFGARRAASRQQLRAPARVSSPPLRSARRATAEGTILPSAMILKACQHHRARALRVARDGLRPPSPLMLPGQILASVSGGWPGLHHGRTRQKSATPSDRDRLRPRSTSVVCKYLHATVPPLICGQKVRVSNPLASEGSAPPKASCGAMPALGRHLPGPA